jgi:hypothetical protein
MTTVYCLTALGAFRSDSKLPYYVERTGTPHMQGSQGNQRPFARRGSRVGVNKG